MRKTDLIHLHALLSCVEADLQERGEVREEQLRAYRELSVSPLSVQASRDRHEEAVLALAGALADAVTEPHDGADDRAEEPERPAV